MKTLDAGERLRMMVLAALMAALIAIGAFMAIPIGPVPIVLQNFFVLLAGLLLGGRWGGVSVAVYLLAGTCGLPVFAGGTGGPGHLLGKSGGYLLGYLPAVVVTGWVSGRARGKVLGEVAAMILGCLIVYAAGTAWLNCITKLGWSKALLFGMYPFLPGDAFKIAAALTVARNLRPLMRARLVTDRYVA